MSETISTDLCIIGAGSGGLSVAAGAAQMGARVVLIERGRMGGDCLNYGCVPSKSLLAAAKRAKIAGSSGDFGITGEAHVDFAKVHDHVHEVIAGIAPHDSQERFESLGVMVLRETARFTGPREVTAGDMRVRAKRFVVATGSSPAVPPIEGLNQVPYFTNETIFDNAERPEHLIIIGGGPIGMEMAQAHRRLGSRVTVLERERVLPKDDPDLARIVIDALTGEGVTLREGIEITGVSGHEGDIAVHLDKAGTEETLRGSHLLVATGRSPNIAALDLDAAGIAHDRGGIRVDKRLRSSNKKVFAIGDVAGGLQFTHMAGYHAGIVIRNALFRLPARAKTEAVPWVTYTDPELAHVGLNEDQARQAHGDSIRVLSFGFDENDRARAERATAGRIKVVTTKGGRILGATIAGLNAGELIHPWVLALDQGMKVGPLANYIAPYPTLGEVGKRVAGSYYTDTLFGGKVRRLVRFLLKLP